MTPVHYAALALADLGLNVHPLVNDEKRPAKLGWQSLATTDPAEIARLFAGGPFNLGVATGAKSGVFVLDVDVKAGAGGLETLAELENRHGALPNTWRAVTPSGGLHLWFRYPTDRRIGNPVRRAPGLDVRGDGGSIVAPPSRVGGRPYRWEREPRADGPAEAPTWLLDLAAPPPRPVAVLPACRPVYAHRRRLARYGERALEGELERVETAKPGTRNQTLFLAALALGSLIGAGVLSEGRVRLGLLSAAELAGLVRDEGRRAVEATISSGLARGMTKPRAVRR